VTDIGVWEGFIRGMTMTEIMATRGLESVVPGQLIEAEVDLMMANDITAPISIKRLKDIGMTRLPFPEFLLVMSHYAPKTVLGCADQDPRVRQGSATQHYYKEGQASACHPARGWVLPGELNIGADSLCT
jgi:3-isopropylmalate/(R)-2-methylmalate dehydratase large subunit